MLDTTAQQEIKMVFMTTEYTLFARDMVAFLVNRWDNIQINKLRDL
jgi:hypothetical protein